MKRRLVGVAAAVLGTVLVSGVGLYSPAAAADPVPLSTVTLPLFGATLKLDITTGPGGALSKVEVTPAAGNTATKLDAHKVVFESANLTDPTGDPAKVVIKSRNGTQKISARAGSLTDFIGQPGGWSGDVFGDGAIGTVGFQIAGTDAAPTISGITATLAGAPAPVIGAVETSSGDDDDENEASARVRITFTNAAGDQSRILSIKVKVEADDGDSEAKLSISLGRVKGVAGKAVGAHTWTGLLCDNALATIPYTIDAAGAITLGTITPAGSTVSTDEGKTVVKFATGERVSIKVRGTGADAQVSVKEKIRCDSADPTTNVSTSIPSDDDDDHNGDDHGRDGGGDDNRGDGDRNRNRGGDDDDDKVTTTTTTTTLA